MKSLGKRQDTLVSLASLLAGAVLTLPLLYCVFTAFKTPAEMALPTLLPESFGNLENFREALSRAPLLSYMGNSLAVALLGSGVRLLLAIPAAYAFAYFRFSGKRLCFFLILATMMLPGDILLMSNYLTVSRLGLLGTYTGVCIVSFVSASQVFILRQRFLAIPRELWDAARLDGCGDVTYLRKILLPVCRPLLTSLFLRSFIALWNSYLWPLVVTAASPEKRTVMVGITKLNSWEDTNYQLVLAGVAISLLPSLLLFGILRRSMERSEADGALVG